MFAKTITSLLVLSSLTAVFVPGEPGSAARAEAPEPVAVISGASYDRWYDNVALIGEISGSPDLAQGLEAMLRMATANQGLAGLDKSRPWALIVVPSREQLTMYTYLPVTDLGQLIEALQPFGKEIAKGGNTREIELTNGRTFHAIEQNGWAVLTPKRKALRHATNDPMRLLGDLPKRYDLALRLHISRLPEIYRTTFLARLNRFDRHERRRPGESDTEYAVRRHLTHLMIEAIIAGIRDLDHVTVGWTLDHDTRQMSAELVLVAKEETPTARRWSRYQKNESDLAGFRLPGATLTSTWVGTLPKVAADALVFVADTAKAEALRDIDRFTRGAERVKLEKQIVTHFFDMIRSPLVGRRLEGATSVALKPEAATCVFATHLPPDEQWREKIQQLASHVRRYPNVRMKFDRDTDRNGDVHLLAVMSPIPDTAEDRETWVRLFGQSIDVVIGAGQQNLYLAFGRDALAALKEAIAASRTAPAVPVAPLECSVALGPVAELVSRLAEGEDKSNAALIASTLKQSAGKDHIRLTVGPADGGGLRVRLELEEGVLRIAGLAVGMVGAKREAAGPVGVE